MRLIRSYSTFKNFVRKFEYANLNFPILTQLDLATSTKTIYYYYNSLKRLKFLVDAS